MGRWVKLLYSLCNHHLILETFSGVRFVSNDKNVLSELQSFYCLLSRLYRPVSFEDGGGGQGGGSSLTTILRFTSHETNNYIFTLLKNRSRTKCQKRYDSPFCKSECLDQITRVLRTNEFSTEASFWKLFCHVQRLSKTFSIL